MTERDSWVYHTPEYWYTTHIASSIRKAHPNLSVFLEHNVGDFRSYAGSRAGRPSGNYRTSGRADITLWKHWKTKNENEAWDAKGIIEVKKAWGWTAKNHGEDINRLCASLLESGKKSNFTQGKVDVALFVIITDEADKENQSAKVQLKKRCFYLEEKIQNYINSKNYAVTVRSKYKLSKYFEEETSMAAAFVFDLTVDKRKVKK